MRVILTLLVASAFVACSVEREEKNYKYQYNYNGCDTGKQEFSSKGAYCSAPLNDRLNNGCARETRQEVYRQECSAE